MIKWIWKNAMFQKIKHDFAAALITVFILLVTVTSEDSRAYSSLQTDFFSHGIYPVVH